MTTEADLRARIAELEARMQAAEAERDAMSRRLDLELDAYAKDADVAVARARAEAAEAALAEAARVLLPFAAAAQRFDEAAEHFKADRPADDSKPRTDFTLGQLRAARAFIDEHGVTFTDDGKAVCVRIGEWDGKP